MKGKSFILGVCLVLLLWKIPLAAADPPECDPSTIPANFTSIPPGISCTLDPDPDTTYDLLINQWVDVTTPISADIRVGYSWSDTPPDDQPRFFFYEPTPGSGNYAFYTWLYARFYNQGATACPQESSTGPVKVVYSYTECTSYTAATDPTTTWTPIGEYVMTIPNSPGALLTNEWHEQVYPVCWILAPGQRFPAQFIVKAEVTWTPDDDTTNNTAYSYFDLRSQKGTAYIALAMDLSGSMGDSFAGSTKLRIAKDKAQLFTHLVELTQYLGVYGFTTGNTGLAGTPPVPGNSPFSTTYIDTSNSTTSLLTFNDTSIISNMMEINNMADKISICNWIDRQGDWGCTPIGQGLLRAKKSIDDATASLTDPVHKGIVLFSDGLQNVPPFLGGLPSQTCFGFPSYPSISLEKNFKNNNIPIYSIFFGDTSGWGYDVMYQAQNETEGMYLYGAATELELAEVYYAIRGMVDDLIYLKKGGTTSAAGPYFQFQVNFDGAADTATVAVAWEQGGETQLTIDRRKKGDKEWIPCSQKHIKTHRTFEECVLYPTFQVLRFTPGANTTWEFRVRQLSPERGQSKFSAAVFSNFEKASITASLGAKGFTAGKALPLYVDLHSGGHAVPGAVVTAVVKIPARCFSSTLRKYLDRFIPGSDLDTGKVGTILPQLKKFLKEETGSDQLYVYNDVKLILRDDGQGPDKKRGDGRYSAVLPGERTHIAGKYEVTFTATGELSAGRKFERFTILSAICNMGPADSAKSVVEMSVSPLRKNKKRIVTITILPTDRYGNAPFPGSSANIKVSTRDRKLKGSVIDNQDSSFTQLLELDEGQSADVKALDLKVQVGDVPLKVLDSNFEQRRIKK
jgi:hypothetical protein